MDLVDSSKIKSAKKRTQVAFEIVESLRSGSLVIAPLEQGYVLVADMSAQEGINQIKTLKKIGEEIYFPLLVAEIEQIAPLCGAVSPEQRLLAMEFWPGPLVLQCTAIAGSMLNIGSSFTPEHIYFRSTPNVILREVCELMGPLVYSPIILENKIVTSVKNIEKSFKQAASHLILGKKFQSELQPTIVSFNSKTPSLLRIGAIEEARIRKIIPNLQVS